MTPLERYTTDHKFIMSAISQATGMIDPVAVDVDSFYEPLITKAKRGPIYPLAGVLVRDWDPDHRKYWPGLRFGIRGYEVDGVRFVRAYAGVSEQVEDHGYRFFAVAREDYPKLYKLAVKLRRTGKPTTPPPVLPAGIFDVLRRNTLDYLSATNLARIKSYGGRAKRGLLLVGPPGNGKTSACRWVYQECLRNGYEYRFVTPDDYQQARSSRNPSESIRELFKFDKPGVVFFDDMDVAIRHRDKYESDDQSVFLSAMDGIEGNEGVVYMFTTNCDLKLIDPAFKRPGRLDVLLQFPVPDAGLRRELVERWHPDIRAALDLDGVVVQTEGKSFAEIEELKNLLVMRFTETEKWEWTWAVDQFAANRRDFNGPEASKGRLGFGAAVKSNGVHG